MTVSNHEYPPSDGRKTLRAPLIILKIKGEENRKTFFGYSKNISRSGMFIATANPREPGTTFMVEIPFPPPINRSIRCKCEVIWQRQFKPKSPYEPGMGLKFLDLPEDVAEEIDQWVRQSLK